MPTIKISYIAERVFVRLEADEATRYWQSIVLTCRQTSEDVESVSDLEILLPWWAFYAAREAIAYQASLAKASLVISEDIKTRLRASIEQGKILSNADGIENLSEDEVKIRLLKAGFSRPLKWFQLRNVSKLARLPVGATFSVPGAGKTTEALAFYTLRATSETRLLVVAPKNALSAWEEQLEECIPSRKGEFVRLTGGRTSIAAALRDGQPKLMLITYQQFVNVDDILISYLSTFDAALFVDESHRIKGGYDRVIAKAILGLSPVARTKMVLSGTPLPNDITDLIPQMGVIAPELKFTAENLQERIQPLYVRTTKTDLDLPDLKATLIPIAMGEAQTQLYQLMRSELAREANSLLSRREKGALRRIGRSSMRLLQFVSNPALLAKKDFEYDALLGSVLEEGDSPKLQYACERARQLASGGKKVIIWSSFVENVELIAERLSDLGGDFIHGGVEASSDYEEDSREAKIRRFLTSDTEAMVLVANPAACSEGISLHTKCHHAIYVDRNYNAAQFLQSVDRIHRIGTSEPKFVEILTCPDTIDDSIEARLTFKTNRMREVLNDPELHINPVPFDPDNAELDEADVLDLIRHLSAPRSVAA